MNTTLIKNETSVLFMEDIQAIDFSMIKLKLQDKEDGLSWSVDQCDAAETEYKKFIALKRTYPDKDIVPNQLVDAFWHQHILDTEKYATDCQDIFGYFLHHFPYFGMRDEADQRNLTRAFEETQTLYSLHFNESYASESSRCRTACKPVKCR